MSDPTENDISIKNDVVYKNWQSIKKSNSKIFAYASLEVVKANLSKTHYPSERLHFVKGKVEDTIPKTIPSKISILRLDTDWYESTKHEMEHLFPLLQVHGILIIDDYGHWKGSRKAVDDYFKSKGIYPFLHRVDYTARLYIKQNQQ
jgi:hypothetical protein